MNNLDHLNFTQIILNLLEIRYPCTGSVKATSGHSQRTGTSVTGNQSPELRILPRVFDVTLFSVPFSFLLRETLALELTGGAFPCQVSSKFSFVLILNLVVVFSLYLTILIESESGKIMER